jgi:hypothetical protein
MAIGARPFAALITYQAATGDLRNSTGSATDSLTTLTLQARALADRRPHAEGLSGVLACRRFCQCPRGPNAKRGQSRGHHPMTRAWRLPATRANFSTRRDVAEQRIDPDLDVVGTVTLPKT